MSLSRAPIAGSRAERGVAAGIAVASVLASALWVSICAASPEFIWRGLGLALDHLDAADLLSLLLIGLVLAFFVEPLVERLQRRVEGETASVGARRRPRNALATAGIGLIFALVSVSVHDAMIAFVSGHVPGDGAGHDEAATGLAAGIHLTLAWAIVPFATALGWLSAANRWLRAPMAIVAAASASVAGWLFGWTAAEALTTILPCLLILGFGYREALRPPRQKGFERCARVVLVVAAIWLLVALLVDLALGFFEFAPFRLYGADNFWIDVRFYGGWAIGLLLAPFPLAAPRNDAAAKRG